MAYDAAPIVSGLQGAARAASVGRG
jgi:hypothetical protein